MMEIIITNIAAFVECLYLPGCPSKAKREAHKSLVNEAFGEH
jgi:hypothetical protein